MTIKKKLLLWLSILGFITTSSSLYLYIYLNKFKNSLDENTTVRRPSLLKISELNSSINKSKNLAFIWKKTDVGSQDKDTLVSIYKFSYPRTKEALQKLSKKWKSKSDIDSLNKILTNYEDVRISQKELMSKLSKFEDYVYVSTNPPDGGLLSMEIDSYVDDITKRSNDIEKTLNKLLDNQRIENQKNEEELQSNMNWMITVLSISSILIIGSVIGLAYLLAKQVTKPLVKIKDLIVSLSKGELKKSGLQKSSDEIGQMVIAVDSLVEGLEKTSSFAENIGKGNYDSEFIPLSEKDVLGNSLIGMRTNLKNVAEIETQRKWATEGVAKFAEILRANSDMDQLCTEIIRNLVKYLGANQGGIFIVNDEGRDPVLELKACYAYDRQKHLEKKIGLGDGLVGQSWLEKDTIFLTDVPTDYINITSGLGLATPTCVIIVPLLYNEEVNGVIEIASFNVFKPYEIEFIEKVAQSIASTLSSVTINHRTAKLLGESRELAEQLKSQEEELRQNQEEMQATSEETERRLAEAQEVIALLKEENTELKSQLKG